MKPSNIIIGLLLLFSPALHAQDFMQGARDYWDEKEGEKAQTAYEAYIVENPQNVNIERRIIYVDLGLSSGTRWNVINESGFYTYDKALKDFGSQVPRLEQWIELRNECEWIWTSGGYTVVGPNGNSIFLPVTGFIFPNTDYGLDDSRTSDSANGYYWSSTPVNNRYVNNSTEAAAWYFLSPGDAMCIFSSCVRLSVRLVQGK